jgi:hypothetical protein
MEQYLKLFRTSSEYSGSTEKPPVSHIIEDVEIIQNIDPYCGHEYVEIGGLKWATMNIGANSVTDYGLYFQWGDTQGYTADQVGTESGKKAFNWADYKYATNVQQYNADMTKYNSTDGKIELDDEDDVAQAFWGGSWRMPTTEEFAALGEAVNTQWVTDYQGSGVDGRLMTDKTDSSKTLFFPACGACDYGSIYGVGSYCYCWSSSLYSSFVQNAYCSYFSGVSSGNW